jgi:restriction system protein
VLAFNPPTLPKRPIVELPTWEVRLVSARDGGPIDLSGEHQRAYAPELERLSSIERHLETLRTQIRSKAREADEAADLADIYVAHQALKFKEFKDSILREYAACKQRYESDRNMALSRAKTVYEEYERSTKTGIENHFHLALAMISLPLPRDYPWALFYEPAKRTVQVNQRLPLLSDIIVKRSDSKRAIAKRDAEHFLRRILPAIVLSIAQQVARNDINDDVDTIVVNGWSRYFEKTTGKLRDAYVATLKVSPSTMRDIDIGKADPLAAFRALGGVFVYSPDEVTPIDPEIRLDKEDRRFVEGREVLSGLAQGQNLGEMDWQDFEHLIRELLSKEFARDGAEVRITRASRDQGVDAVIFNPDPLRGGKYVVQAKRYNSVVELSAVRDLWGTVNSEGASRGILVTTSWFGRDAYEWISNKSITLIDGQNLLALLTKHGYRFTIPD